MAVRKLMITFGQSNGGAKADYTEWQALHAGLAVDFELLSSNHSQGAYNDTFLLPGHFPDPLINLKGRAVRPIRYLSFYNPVATGLAYLDYPHTGRIVSTIAEDVALDLTQMVTDRAWQYSPQGRTIVREATGTSHTISLWVGGAFAAQLVVSPRFDPPPVPGEQFTYPIYAGAVSPSTSILKLDMRFGGDYGANVWVGSLAGCRIKCLAGANNNDVRYIDSLTLNGAVIVEVTVTEAWDALPQAGDRFELSPPQIAGVDIPWDQWAYWLPYSPLEGQAIGLPLSITAAADAGGGSVTLTVTNTLAVNDYVQIVGGTYTGYNGEHRVTARTGATITIVAVWNGASAAMTGTVRRIGKLNPYPPGFSQPSQYDNPALYQPFKGGSIMYGVAAQYDSARAAYHVGLAQRIFQVLSEDIYVASLALDGTQIAHTELNANADTPIGWHDPKQQTSWAAGEPNNCFGRLEDTLDAAVASALDQGDTLELVGLFFIQGEGDASFPDTAAQYAVNLRAFKTKVRQACVDAGIWTGTAATIPWIQPQISGTSMVTPWPFQSLVNSAITAEAAVDEYMRTFEMSDATKIVGDEAHYDADGITLLEDRCFAEWHELWTSDGSDAEALWAQVVAQYDASGLIPLTNIRDRSAVAIDTAAGVRAAQSVIDLWAMHAQVAYDGTDSHHVTVAVLGVIALLWRRGGSASAIEQVKWEEVFGSDGLLSKIRKTGPRARVGPITNSGVSTAPERLSDGSSVRGWSDRASLPPGYLPNRRSAEDD